MLVELKKLSIVNKGYNRVISLDKFYVNSNSILSLSDYSGASAFLLRESPDNYSQKSYSILKFTEGPTVEEVIVLGTAEELFRTINGTDKMLLND